jgi:hypothetical protein
MGKAAENERIKLRATRFNNISVGLFLAGVLIPYLAFVREVPELSYQLASIIKGTEKISEIQIMKALAWAFGIALAFWGARRFRREAYAEIAKIQD